MLEISKNLFISYAFFHTLRDVWNIFSHKYGTFLQQISAPSSSLSEVAFSPPPSVKWSPLRSPKSNRFQRIPRATLHGVSTADQNGAHIDRSNDVGFLVFLTVFLVEQSYLPLRTANKRKKKQVRKTSIQKL